MTTAAETASQLLVGSKLTAFTLHTGFALRFDQGRRGVVHVDLNGAWQVGPIDPSGATTPQAARSRALIDEPRSASKSLATSSLLSSDRQPMNIAFTPGGLGIDDVVVERASQPSAFTAAFGISPRVVDAGPRPAPPGHRNNQVHLFDTLGIYLLEHHAHRVVTGVEFVLTEGACSFEPESTFQGTIRVNGVAIRGDMPEQRLPLAGPALTFRRFLDTWSWESSERYAALVMSHGSSRRDRTLASATYCFRAKRGGS